MSNTSNASGGHFGFTMIFGVPGRTLAHRMPARQSTFNQRIPKQREMSMSIRRLVAAYRHDPNTRYRYCFHFECRMSGISRTLSKIDAVSSFNRTVSIYCAENARNGTSANRQLWSRRKYLIGCPHRHEWLDLDPFPVLFRRRLANRVCCLARRCPWREPSD
jgi:hypothetical protein